MRLRTERADGRRALRVPFAGGATARNALERRAAGSERESREARRPRRSIAPDDGHALVRRVQAELPRGTGSFREMVRIYSPMIRRRAVRMVGNECDAEEIVQDVFLRVFRSIDGFRFERPLRNWLYTITSNSARNLLRARIREGRRRERYSKHRLVAGEADHRGAPSIREPLLRCLDRLDATTRLSIVLRYVEELTFPEIAREVDLRESAVKMRVRRGLDRLRAELGGRHGVG
ncbi:MAG: sigma-70 family RNA polymerase sigma factor [Myxococcota bacterium]